MLNNVTKNRKCHHHLANKDFVNYLIRIFNGHFYNKYDTTAASTAHRATIKNIMHVLTRLMDDSMYGRDLLVDNNIATIIRSLQEQSSMNASHVSTRTTMDLDHSCASSETKTISRQSSAETTSSCEVPKKPRITQPGRKLSVNSAVSEIFL